MNRWRLLNSQCRRARATLSNFKTDASRSQSNFVRFSILMIMEFVVEFALFRAVFFAHLVYFWRSFEVVGVFQVEVLA